MRLTSPDLIANSEQFHKFLADGVDVENPKKGEIMGDKVWLVDFEHLEDKAFLVVNHFTVTSCLLYTYRGSGSRTIGCVVRRIIVVHPLSLKVLCNSIDIETSE
ncbi:hypothetical protein CULT_80062 [[Clostridium] ultunense Esp]|nr:hypothetical protein CULT_80062 [[Clostridium] ultunense Esp]